MKNMVRAHGTSSRISAVSRLRRLCFFALALTACLLLLPDRPASAEMDLSTGVIIGDRVALRRAASSGSRLLARLSEGTTVTLLEANVNAEWYKVEVGNRVGYVNRMYINLEQSMDSYHLEYEGTVVNCQEDINVRSSASTNGSRIGTAKKGEVLAVTRANYAPGWHQVRYDGRTGYVSASYIDLSVKTDDNSLTGLEITGGTLSPSFSPNEYGYILTADEGQVTVKATANSGVKISVGDTGISSAKYTINSGNSKTIRISVNGKVRYSIYLVRDVLTVGTWNIKRGNDNLVMQGWLIANQKPDIIGIQEVYVNSRNNVNNLLSLRTRASQNTAFASTVEYNDGGRYGIGQISRYQPVTNEKFPLDSGGNEQRYLQRVVYNIDGESVSVYNTHFSYESASIRKKQFDAVLQKMDEDENKYRILVGDFNAKEPEFALFLKDYKIVNTSDTKFYDYAQNRLSFNQIDNIIVSKNITVLNARAIPTTYSDHCPLFAFLALK